MEKSSTSPFSESESKYRGNHEESSNSSSLTLSLTPPLSEGPKEKTSSISEHLSSIENDRSMQEVEVPGNFSLMLQELPADDVRLSQEPKPSSLNSNFNTTSNSVISLNGLEQFIGTHTEERNNVKSILEEILNNDQFKSDSETTSLDIFANVDLDDKILNSYNSRKNTDFNLKSDSLKDYDDVFKKMNDLEELISIKDTTIAALTSELDSLREIVSNPSSNSFGTNTTEYKQFQEECHNKLVEYHTAITHKDEQIEKLTTSLQQSILAREEMKQHFKNEISQLQEQLTETSKLLREHRCVQDGPKSFEEAFSQLQGILHPNQINQVNILKATLEDHIQKQIEENKKGYKNEIENLKIKLESDKQEYDTEITRLRDLLSSMKSGSDDIIELKQELDAKHSKEMEELRTYFEKKCADLEKNYSEEIFSQQSRKMSGSSSCSDADLPSDFVFNQPGPGGDVKPEYTKKDLTKFQNDLNQMLNVFGRFNLNQISDEDLIELRNEINKFDMRNFLKYDLSLIKNELQNKYHAELEILREDFDNRVDILNVEHENKCRSLEKKYLDEIEDLNIQLRGRISTTVQEVGNSGEFEIDEVVQSYERRLQEQVTLAKIDIIAALENQIQRLVSSESIDEDWPEELLQLKERFAKKYHLEIEQLKQEHQGEISRLKEEHVKNLYGALERARRRSLRDSESLSKTEMELLKERDALKKQNLTLKYSLGELCKYFTQCEEELNNTIVEELFNKISTTNVEEDVNQEMTDSFAGTKRVHLTPNISDLINLIDNSFDNDLDSIDLKGELGMCLEKLKADANAILALSSNMNKDSEKPSVSVNPKNSVLEREVSSLTRKLISETQLKNELAEQLNETKEIVKSLEADRNTLEDQLEQILERQKIMEEDLIKAQEKIAELIENGHKEIVSEGYGEDGQKSVKGLDDAVVTLRELQEKARNLTENPGNVNHSVVLLLEDLSRVGEKILEEASKDRDDLRQQVENLEQQLREANRLQEQTETRCKEIEEDRQEAVQKIFELRDIIRDLEEQVKIKSKSEDELKSLISELEHIVKHQERSSSDSNRQGDLEVSDIQELRRYIGNLEGEVQKLKLNTEIAGSEGPIQQIKNHLCDFETTLDKRTKDLEGLHSTLSTTCSSPSEDMSIRDVVHTNTSNITFDECELPLQQLARLKEKLIRHSRAEDAAVKRIQDLEMQICGLKNELEECQNEREILKKQNSDHIVLISNLQIRLDEQRIRAEHIEKQTNTSLEIQIYDLKNMITSLEETITKRDKAIAQLQANNEEFKQRLEEWEKEASTNPDPELVAQIEEKLEFLRTENLKLKSRINNETLMLPGLVENIIAEKNNEIEILKDKLLDAEKEMKIYSSCKLSKNQIEALNKLKLSGVSLDDLLDLTGPDVLRREPLNESLALPQPIHLKRNVNETTLLGIEPEISRIEKVGPPNLFHSLQSPIGRPNSTEKHVRFEDEENRLADLRNELKKKDEIIQDLEARLSSLKDLEIKIGQLQEKLEETEEILKTTTNKFKVEQKEYDDKEKAVRLELAAKKVEVSEKNGEIETLKAKLVVTANLVEEKDNEIVKKENEIKNLLDQHEVALKKQQDNFKDSVEKLKQLEEQMTKLKIVGNKELEEKDKKIEELKGEIEQSRQTSSEHVNKLQEQVAQLEKFKDEKNLTVEELTKQVDNLNKELTHLQFLLSEKDKVIAQMTEDSKSLHVNLETIQSKLQETGNIVDLGRRLREEQKKNTELVEELHKLKAQLLSVEGKTIDDIAGQVQKQLDISAHLDSTLIGALSDNSIDNQDFEALKVAVKKLKVVNKQLVKAKESLDKKLEDLECKHDQLLHTLEETKTQLERERTKLHYTQLEDAKLIEQLRVKLDSALDNEIEIKKSLEREKRERVKAEEQLHLLKIQKAVQSTTSTDSSTAYKDIAEEDKLKVLKKEIAMLQSDNDDLNHELKMLRDVKIENEKNLKYQRDLVELKNDEISKLENKIKGVTINEQNLKIILSKLKTEVKEKNKQLEKGKVAMEELETGRRTLTKQLDQLNQRLKVMDSAVPLPEYVIEKIQDLKSAVMDNMQLVDIISRLTNEKKVLEDRILQLESQKAVELPFDDPVARANYLFAKYLRADSYRKALIWQKRYLIYLLESYQNLENVRLQNVHLAQVPSKRSTGKNRFKRVGLAIMALNRIQYLVRRWHSGKRIAQERMKNDNRQEAHFQVGQPVSNQNFNSKTKPSNVKFQMGSDRVEIATYSALNNSPGEMSWCGNSPPSKDRNSSTPRSTSQVLNSPGLLLKYVERFNQIQEKLGLDTNQ